MKRALFFTHRNPQGYRIQQYFPFLEKKGFDVELITTKTMFIKILPLLKNADVVYIQRLLFDPVKLTVIRKVSKKLIYDFDDAVMFGSKGESPTRRKKFRLMVSKADVVLCGNHFLLSEAKKYKNRNLFYCPTVVDINEYPKKEHRDTTPVIMGWIGSKSTLKYLFTLQDMFFELKNREPQVELKIIADYAPELNINFIFEKWDKDKEKHALLSLDMGIMPLWDDIWTRGKCGLKLIQYMATGLPSIAHPVGVVNEIIEDGINGFVREKKEDWIEIIKMLKKDTKLRKKIGMAARETIEEKYSLHKWGPFVADIMDNL